MNIANTILLKFAFGLSLCHLFVGSKIESETKVLADTAFFEVNLHYFCISTVIEFHANVPPIRWQ